jgi:colicin import membrane protein
MCIGLHPTGLSGKLCEEWLAGKIERRKVVFAPGVAEARAAAEAAVVAALQQRGVTDLQEVSDKQRRVFEAESKVRGEVARRGRAALQAKLVARRAPEKAEEAQRAAEKAEKAQRAAAEKAERVAAAQAQRAAAAAAAMEVQRVALVRQELERLQLLCRVQGGTGGGAPSSRTPGPRRRSPRPTCGSGFWGR